MFISHYPTTNKHKPGINSLYLQLWNCVRPTHIYKITEDTISNINLIWQGDTLYLKLSHHSQCHSGSSSLHVVLCSALPWTKPHSPVTSYWDRGGPSTAVCHSSLREHGTHTVSPLLGLPHPPRTMCGAVGCCTSLTTRQAVQPGSQICDGGVTQAIPNVLKLIILSLIKWKQKCVVS